MKFVKLSLLTLISVLSAYSQTIYLGDSGPQYSTVCGASTSGTPMTITTCQNHGLTTGDLVTLGGVCTNNGVSHANGVRIATVTGSTTFTITDTSSTAIPSDGAWGLCSGSGGQGSVPGGAQWVKKVHSYSLGTGPLGWYDGLNGTNYRKLSLSTLNGLTSIVVSGNVATVTTTYVHGVLVGDKVSITGTTNTALNTANGTGAFAPYTVTGATTNTFTFTTVGVSNGTYTGNNICGPASTPNGTIGGSQPCEVVSQFAYTGNPAWDTVITYSGTYHIDTSPDYKFIFDTGGKLNPWTGGLTTLSAPALAAVRFQVDRANTQLMTDLDYYFTKLEMFGVGNWYANETDTTGGNGAFQGGDGNIMFLVTFLYSATSPYESSASNTIFRNKIYNDVDDPTAVTSKTHALGVFPAVVTGTSQATTTNTVTISASDSAATNFYVGNYIYMTYGAPGSVRYDYRKITANDGATKVVTVSGTWSTTVPASTVYSVIASVSISSLAGATAGVTVTGHNTHFTTDLNVGDGIQGFVTDWYAKYTTVPSQTVYVTGITDDTHCTVTTSTDPSQSWPAIGVEGLAWYGQHWATGDVGLVWLLKHNFAYGSQPLVYPPNGGTQTVTGITGPPYTPWIGSNFSLGDLSSRAIAGLTMAVDSRAVRDLAIQQTAMQEFEVGHYMSYGAAFSHNGSGYSAPVTYNLGLYAWWLSQSVPSYPSVDQSNLSGWLGALPLYKMYSAYADIQNNTMIPMYWGTSNSQTPINIRGGTATSYLLDPVFVGNPTSSNAQYLKSWLQNTTNFPASTYNPSNGLNGFQGMSDTNAAIYLLHNDPRIGTSNYQSQPKQVLLNQTSASTATTVTGQTWTCSGGAAVSRTGWTSKTDTVSTFESRCYWTDHDNPFYGSLKSYKVGPLLYEDSADATGQQRELADNTVVGTIPQFGGTGSNVSSGQNGNTSVQGNVVVNEWSGSTYYGDVNSKYMRVCSNLASGYTITFNYAQRCIWDLKWSTDQFLVQWDQYSPSSSTPIVVRVHYPQNGQATDSAYPEGNTTCPGTGGCSNLNATRWIQSMEDNGNDGVNPQRAYGIITNFLSPDTISVIHDCGTTQCVPGSTYPGGYGKTDRVSLCGGASCGTSVTQFRSFTVHKIAGSNTDTSLNTASFSAGTGWMATQMYGANNCAVILEATGGGTVTPTTSFTPPSQTGVCGSNIFYGLGNVATGTYSITVGGSAVTGSPFTVAAGDNSIAFIAGTGLVSFGTGPTVNGSSLGGNGKIGGKVIIKEQ